MKSALAGIRILDLAGAEGQFCGRLLADLGAEVIKVEPPSGDPARRVAPLMPDATGGESGLGFLHFNTNKKSVVIDRDSAEGQGQFLRLASTADAIIETSGRVDYKAVMPANPGLVVVSITGFGMEGPHSVWNASSIVVSAMGGIMYLCGSPDKPPLAEPEYQPHHLASAFAAYGLLLGLRSREFGGVGQRVEVSCQEVNASQQHVVVNYGANEAVLVREGNRGPLGGGMPEGVYPGRDGFCHVVIIPRAHWRSLVGWMGNPEPLTDPIWENRHVRNANLDFVEPQVLDFMNGLTKEELFRQGQERRVPIGPINRPDEFTRDLYALERGAFLEVEREGTGRCRQVGSPFRMSGTPGAIFRPAPTLGRDNEEVIGSLAHSGCEGRAPVPSVGRSRNSRKIAPLKGVRVLDFTFAIAGPVLTQLLGENGAEVIKGGVGCEAAKRSGAGGVGPEGGPAAKGNFRRREPQQAKRHGEYGD